MTAQLNNNNRISVNQNKERMSKTQKKELPRPMKL